MQHGIERSFSMKMYRVEDVEKYAYKDLCYSLATSDYLASYTLEQMRIDVAESFADAASEGKTLCLDADEVRKRDDRNCFYSTDELAIIYLRTAYKLAKELKDNIKY
jgi:hypothetical protein